MEDNNRLKAKLDHARQVAHQSSDPEACIIAALARAADKEARNASEAKASEDILMHQSLLQ
jgi:hypothetical protein